MTPSTTYNSCPFSTIGANITITHSVTPSPFTLTEDVQKQLTATADKHLQKAEWKKYMRQNKTEVTQINGDTTMRELIDANTILLSFAIDPHGKWHGKWGLITNNFLLPTTIRVEPTFPNSRPYGKIMYHKAITSPSPTAMLQTADNYWSCNRKRNFFGHSYSAPTPKIYTFQQLGLGISKALATHIRNCKTTSTSTNTAPPNSTQESYNDTDTDLPNE